MPYLREYAHRLQKLGPAAFTATHSSPVLLGLGILGLLPGIAAPAHGLTVTITRQALEESATWANRVFELVGERRLNTSGRISLGRTPESDVIVNDSSISRAQCYFDVESARFLIVDAGSRNGTLVNERRLKRGESCTLFGNEIIGLGRLAFRFLTASEFQKQAGRDDPSGSPVPL